MVSDSQRRAHMHQFSSGKRSMVWIYRNPAINTNATTAEHEGWRPHLTQHSSLFCCTGLVAWSQADSKTGRQTGRRRAGSGSEETSKQSRDKQTPSRALTDVSVQVYSWGRAVGLIN
ncbi:unnamed protein product [Boreogadus saida]